MPYQHGEVGRQDLPEPGGEFAFSPAPKLGEVAVCLQEGFLDQVGSIDLTAETPAYLQASEQRQVMAVKVQQLDPRGRGPRPWQLQKNGRGGGTISAHLSTGLIS